MKTSAPHPAVSIAAYRRIRIVKQPILYQQLFPHPPKNRPEKKPLHNTPPAIYTPPSLARFAQLATFCTTSTHTDDN